MDKTIDQSIKAVGIDYHSFMELFKNQVEKPNLNNESELIHYENRKLNFHRTLRLMKTFTPSKEMIDVVSSISTLQTWMIITETWCGDSAQSVPIITQVASINDKINLRIVFRDEKLNIMDNYLTDGSRSIPKLVVFDEEDKELFQWGPRPANAQNLVKRLKQEGHEKSEINKQLHLWYAKNRGLEIEKELLELITNLKV